jgi:hypothetical protein
MIAIASPTTATPVADGRERGQGLGWCRPPLFLVLHEIFAEEQPQQRPMGSASTGQRSGVARYEGDASVTNRHDWLNLAKQTTNIAADTDDPGKKRKIAELYLHLAAHDERQAKLCSA